MLAYQIAGLSRMNRLPPLEQLMPKRATGPLAPKTEAEMLSAGVAFAAALDGRFTPAPE